MPLGLFDYNFKLDIPDSSNVLLLVFEYFPECEAIIDRFLSLLKRDVYILLPHKKIKKSLSKKHHYYCYPENHLLAAGKQAEAIGSVIGKKQISHVIFIMKDTAYILPEQADYIRRHFYDPTVWGVDIQYTIKPWHDEHMREIINGETLLLYGLLNSGEGNLLYQSVKALSEIEGEIVEIGSWAGKSTICMALALDITPNKIFAIDKQFQKMFKLNAERFNVQDKIAGIEHPSPEALEYWLTSPENHSKKIKLLFIDGGHHYENVITDINTWEPYLTVGGYIFFHDYVNIYPGIQRAVHELIINSGRFTDPLQHGCLFGLKKNL